jgi:nickel-dependent lactate racemase
MNAAGVKDSQITIIIALGTHRFMTPEEILQKFGEEIVRRVAVRNHDYKNEAELIDLGTTPNGTHVTINREAWEADFKIGVGSIVPHHIPGYAGGAKIVQPGICGEQTTAETHLLSVKAPRSYLGVTENPVRAEVNAIARRVGLNTILNTVLNRYGEVVEAFFGDVVDAFDEGVKLSRNVYSIEIPEEADIVLSSSHPCDIEFWQAHKALYPSDLAVRAGGIIIVATPCPEGVAMMHQDILEVTRKDACGLREMVSCKLMQDEVAAALAIAWAQVKERASVYIVSDGICADDAEKLGFTHFETIQKALAAALRAKGDNARITVLTHAPDMLPVIAPIA